MTQTFDVKFWLVGESLGLYALAHAEAMTAEVLKLKWVDGVEFLGESWTGCSKVAESIEGHWYFCM